MLTRGGWAALGLAALAIVTGRVFGVLELFVLAVAAAGAVVIALVRVRAARPQVVVGRTVEPAPAAVGEPAVVTVEVLSRGRGRSARLSLWEEVRAPGRHQAPLGVAIDVPRLRRGRSHEMRYALPTDRRGVVRLGPATATVADPFGLARRTVTVGAAGPDEVVVLPRFTPVAFPGGVSSGPLAARLRARARAGGGDEFHSLRPYVDGDDPRRIDWKATARSNDVLVRVTEPDSLRRCTVVFDTSGRWPDEATFEWAVSAVASLVVGAQQAGLEVRALGPGVDLRGPDVAITALHWLARVEPGDGEIPPARRGGGLGLVVIVAATANSPSVIATQRRTDPQQVTTVIDAAAWSSVPFERVWSA